MTREEAKKIVNLYSIIEAYANGETIEVFDEPGKWKELEKYSFTWSPEHYRIKPKLEFRPFKNSAECLEEMKKHNCFGWVINKFTKISINMILICDHFCRFIDEEQNYDCNYEEMLKDYTFLDGTPFGIKVEI